MLAGIWVGYHGRLLAGLERKIYGVCCGYLSRSPAPARAGFLNAHGMSSGIDGQKPWLKEKPDYR